jgi:hypothetical protein
LTEEPKSPRQSIVLDRNEWESFVSEVKKLIEAHSKLLNKVKKQEAPLLWRGREKHSPLRKPSFSSLILSFLGLKPKSTRGRFCQYCGVQADPEDKFCRICGKNIDVRGRNGKTQER